MNYYPLYLNIENRLCVVVGGGRVAERKIIALLEAGAKVLVVSPFFTPMLAQYEAEGRIDTFSTYYAAEVLEGASLVFAATDNSQVNAQVLADAAQRGILANSADAPEKGDFITPATIRRGDLLLSVTTSGNTPTLAAQIVRDLEMQFGTEYAAYVELLGQKRDYVKGTTENPLKRKAALAGLVDARIELLELLRSGDVEAAERRTTEIVEGALTLASRSDRTESP